MDLTHIELPSFRVKRPHRKSRSGCLVCKQRRVKCDETRPSCKTCKQRGQKCAYEKPPKEASPASFTAVGESSPRGLDQTAKGPPIASSPTQASLDSPSVTDTHLAQRYFMHTASTFEANSTRMVSQDFWRIILPALTYSSLSCRHVLLAVSALDLFFNGRGPLDDNSDYVQAAVYHGPIALTECGKQLQDIEEVNVDSILACSRVLCVLGFAFFRNHRKNGSTIRDPEAWTWIRMLRGVRNIQSKITESGYSIDPMLLRDMAPELPPHGYTAETMVLNHNNPVLALIDASRLERFNTLHIIIHNFNDALSSEQRDMCVTAVLRLQEVTNHICEGEMHSLFRALCTWATPLPEDFSEMLADGHLLALAIYAHWLMLVVLAEDMWWIGDMGRAGLRDIVQLCAQSHVNESDPHSLDVLMEWPKQVLMLTEGAAS